MMNTERSVDWLAGRNKVCGENMPQCQFVHHMTWAGHKTWAIMTGSQRLTTWVMAWSTVYSFKYYFFHNKYVLTCYICFHFCIIIQGYFKTEIHNFRNIRNSVIKAGNNVTCINSLLHTSGPNDGTAITWLHEHYNVIRFLISEDFS